MTSTSIKALLSVATAVLLAVLLIWLALAFAGLEKEIKVPVIAGCFAVLIVILTYVRENNLKRQEAHRQKKIEIYSDFYEMIIGIVRFEDSQKQDAYLRSKKFIDNMFVFKKNIMFYGSPAVIKAFNDFQGKAQSAESSSTVHRVGNILVAMRKDVGLSNLGLKGTDILQTIITDDLNKNLGQRRETK